MKRTVYIGHATALFVWHAERLREAQRRPGSWIGSRLYRPFKVAPQPQCNNSAAGISSEQASLRQELGIPDAPIHVIVDANDNRTQAAGLVAHSLRCSNLPEGAFYTIRQGLCIASPELLFLTMASILDLEDLIELGCMACGTYTFSFNREGRSVGCPPLTSADRIREFLERVHSVRGLAKARQAAQYVCDGANSPRETQFVQLICLPARLHGMACPYPELNGSLSVGSGTIHPDFCWRRQGVVGEYNGLQHGDVDQMLQDARRLNGFTGARLRTFTVTNEHFAATDKLVMLGDLVRRLLGMRRRAWTESELDGIDRLRRRFTDVSRVEKWKSLYLTGAWCR